MKLSDFDFHVPEELVAQRPLAKRESSRMMVVNRRTGKIENQLFTDLPNYIRATDIVVFNKTRVRKARLIGQRPSGGKVEIFLLNQISVNRFECMVKATAANKENMEVLFEDSSRALILGPTVTPMIYEVELQVKGEIEAWIDAQGRIPLPPYIHRDADVLDADRYQTLFARELGSVAAPTAGLHFTESTLAKLRETGADLREVILHVGLGTFQPIKSDLVEDHRMHRENFYVDPDLAEACRNARVDGKRVVAVGTTSVRALESCARGFSESTNIFLKPGEKFHWVDALFTNFHQPKSTLIVMLAAFLEQPELWREAYAKAVEDKYRFFSYGDCMLVIND